MSKSLHLHEVGLGASHSATLVSGFEFGEESLVEGMRGGRKRDAVGNDNFAFFCFKPFIYF